MSNYLYNSLIVEKKPCQKGVGKKEREGGRKEDKGGKRRAEDRIGGEEDRIGGEEKL